MVIMVAPPASGKSTFCRRYLVPHGYVWINRDTLSTAAKCLKVSTNAAKHVLGFVMLPDVLGVPIDLLMPLIPHYTNPTKRLKSRVSKVGVLY